MKRLFMMFKRLVISFLMLVLAESRSFASPEREFIQFLSRVNRILTPEIPSVRSSIPWNYARIHTVGGDEFRVVPPRQHMSHIQVNSIASLMQKPDGIRITLADFHEQVFGRIEGRRDSLVQVGFVPSSSISSPRQILSLRTDRLLTGSFKDNSYFRVSCKLDRPLIAATMYEDPLDGSFIYPKWYTPLEIAFYLQSMGEYREALALLRPWAAYSRMGFTAIPQGTYVDMRIGLAGSQTYPSNVNSINNYKFSEKEMPLRQFVESNPLLLKELESNEEIERLRNRLFQIDGRRRDVWELIDFQPGGFLQILAAYADGGTLGTSSIPVYSIESLFSDGRKLEPKYIPLSQRSLSVLQKHRTDGRMLHLDDLGYDQIELDLPLAMSRERGILTTEEVRLIRSVNFSLKSRIFYAELMRAIQDHRITDIEALRRLNNSLYSCEPLGKELKYFIQSGEVSRYLGPI